MDDSIYRLRLRDVLKVCVLALLALGIVIVQSAAMSITGDPRWHWTSRGMKHLAFAGVAVMVFFVVGHIDYTRLLRNEKGKMKNEKRKATSFVFRFSFFVFRSPI